MSTYSCYLWKEIPKCTYYEICKAFGGVAGMRLYSSFTDNEGQYGEPKIQTDWAIDGADYPIIRSEYNPKVEGSQKYFIAYWKEEHA